MSDAPLLSLIIPTKNRKVYLLSLLAEIVRQRPSRLEVIIHDNSDSRDLESDVAALGAGFVRYFHTSDPIGVHENFDRAVEKATGDYLCAIGDDDGLVISAALEVLEEAKQQGIDAILTERIFFSWPGVRHRLWGDSGGKAIRENLYHGLQPHVRDPLQSLGEVFDTGSLDGLAKLPRVYHGYVSRSAMDRLRQHCGSCFPGGSPDMANAAALTGIVNKLMISRRVTNITGHSPKSGGGEGAAGIHHAELADAHYLREASRQNWEQGIPRFWSGLTVYAQAAIEGAKATDAQSPVPFNYMKLCAACMVYQPSQYRQHILEAVRQTYGNSALVRARFYAMAALLFLQRALGLVRTAWRVAFKRNMIGQFPTVAELMASLDSPTRKG